MGGPEGSWDWMPLLGRLHPLAVHFPIAFLLLSGVLEAAQVLRKSSLFRDAAFVCSLTGAAGALLASFTGWANAASGGHDDSSAGILLTHRWLGLSIAAVSLVAAVLGVAARRREGSILRGTSRSLQILLVPALLLQGHLGGMLVFGESYITSALPGFGANKPVGPHRPGRIEFQRDIQPILKAHCIRCHGEAKAKGGLRVDSKALLLKGGDSGPAVHPGSSGRSLLHQRLVTTDPAERMPQKSAPLSPSQIDLIGAWIDQGAPD